MNDELSIQDQNPAGNYRRATDVAGICKEIVLRTAVNITGKKYVRAEGWLAIATAHGCVAGARDVERVEGGVRAIGEVRRVSDGTVLATSEGFVGDDEPMWQKRPEYAKRAMCQTRAISRVCRAAFAHVVVLMDAGLSTVPAEEVPDGGFDENEKQITDREDTREQHARVVGESTRKRETTIRQPAARATGEDFPANPLDESDSLPTKRIEPNGWQDVVVHFGKNKGVRLGDMEPQQLRWYQKDWEPRPYKGRISDQDTDLREALDASLGKAPTAAANNDTEEEPDGIPF